MSSFPKYFDALINNFDKYCGLGPKKITSPDSSEVIFYLNRLS